MVRLKMDKFNKITTGILLFSYLVCIILIFVYVGNIDSSTSLQANVAIIAFSAIFLVVFIIALILLISRGGKEIYTNFFMKLILGISIISFIVTIILFFFFVSYDNGDYGTVYPSVKTALLAFTGIFLFLAIFMIVLFLLKGGFQKTTSNFDKIKDKFKKYVSDRDIEGIKESNKNFVQLNDCEATALFLLGKLETAK